MRTKHHGLTPPAEIAAAGQQLVTPFLRARQEWDQRTGTLLKQKSNWQRATAALTVAVVVQAAAVALVANQVTVKAYVVEVAETGQVRTVGILPQEWQGHTLAPVEFLVRQWLLWTRTISTDPVVFGQQWEQAREYMTAKGWAMLSAHLQQQHERMTQGETVQITFGNMLPVAGYARSFAVEWHEQRYGQQGFVLSNTQWKAILKIAILPPQNINDLRELRNPLGVFIEEVQWNERVTDRRSN